MTKQELEIIRNTPVGGVFRFKGQNYEVRRDRKDMCLICAFHHNQAENCVVPDCLDYGMPAVCSKKYRTDHKNVIFITTTKPVSTPKRGLWKRIVELIKR